MGVQQRSYYPFKFDLGEYVEYNGIKCVVIGRDNESCPVYELFFDSDNVLEAFEFEIENDFDFEIEFQFDIEIEFEFGIEIEVEV